MRILPGICRRFAPLAIVFCAALAFGCDGLPAGQILWVRLSAPVSSYSSKAGDTVHAVLTEAVVCDNQVVFPIGTGVEGVVQSVRKVGWGIRHETAALQIRFGRFVTAQGLPAAASASVVEVENAREQVNSKGVIQGIRSSDTPEGRINSRLIHLPTYNPYSDLGLIVYKATFPIFPEPEIYYPAGTDLRLKLTDAVHSLPVSPTPVQSAPETISELDVEQMAPSLPARSTTSKGADADVVNIAFVGSRAQVESAFKEAGWSTSDPFSRRTFVHTFYAFLNDSTYAQAPMKPLFLDGKPADMNWQKSLNSYNRRDHLRMWQWSETSDSETVWLSSSTHDTRATLSVKQHQFVHHIAPDIDDERSTVIRDLELAGCIQSVHLVPRRGVSNLTQNANGDPVRTDGDLAIVQLKDCQPLVPGLPSSAGGTNFKAGNHAFRYLRRQILTFRSDIWRANIIYGAYDLTRMTIETFRHHPIPPPTQQAQADARALQMGGAE